MAGHPLENLHGRPRLSPPWLSGSQPLCVVSSCGSRPPTTASLLKPPVADDPRQRIQVQTNLPVKAEGRREPVGEIVCFLAAVADIHSHHLPSSFASGSTSTAQKEKLGGHEAVQGETVSLGVRESGHLHREVVDCLTLRKTECQQSEDNPKASNDAMARKTSPSRPKVNGLSENKRNFHMENPAVVTEDQTPTPDSLERMSNATLFYGTP